MTGRFWGTVRDFEGRAGRLENVLLSDTEYRGKGVRDDRGVEELRIWAGEPASWRRELPFGNVGFLTIGREEGAIRMV